MPVGDQLTAEDKSTIIIRKAQGISGRKIGEEIGVSRVTVNKYARQEEIRREIEQQAVKLAKVSSKIIVKNNIKVLKAAVRRINEDPELNDLSTKDLLDLADKKEKRIGESIGLFASNTKVNNILNLSFTSNSYISPVVLQAITTGIKGILIPGVGVEGGPLLPQLAPGGGGTGFEEEAVEV